MTQPGEVRQPGQARQSSQTPQARQAHANESVASRVIRWQRTHGRHGLPWQGTRDPYRVWLSEVMLQQTQVSVVLDYYPRFLQRFPDVQALAAAPLDDVFALWSGLGYYSRARNLHRCAQAVAAEHGGTFPGTSVGLAALPGIGRSTAAAIAAFCFDERAAILDGNVKRVLTRVLGFDGDLSSASVNNALWAHAQDLLPEHDVGIYTQGLMDLGATVCLQRKPLCLLCPLSDDCTARIEGAPERYPVKTRKLRRSARDNALLWLRQGAQLYLVQRPAVGVWAGLWSLPEYASAADLEGAAAGWPGRGEWLPSFQHTLTHVDWTLHTLQWTLPLTLPLTLPQLTPEVSGSNGRWVSQAEALAMGLPAPLRKLLLQLPAE